MPARVKLLIETVIDMYLMEVVQGDAGCSILTMDIVNWARYLYACTVDDASVLRYLKMRVRTGELLMTCAKIKKPIYKFYLNDKEN